MFEYEREQLTEKLKTRGISDPDVLHAIGTVERHLFVPEAMRIHAYKDTALPIGQGQTISQPFTVAFMTQALKPTPDKKILEIGTGSGYQAAILEKLGMKVFSVERHRDLFMKTQSLFDKIGVRAVLRCGDGTIGWSEFAPYDGIIVTAGGPTIPESLKKQLSLGGRMVIPVGDRKQQSLRILTRIEENRYELEEIPNFAFVPLIGREGWKKE